MLNVFDFSFLICVLCFEVRFAVESDEEIVKAPAFEDLFREAEKKDRKAKKKRKLESEHKQRKRRKIEVNYSQCLNFFHFLVFFLSKLQELSLGTVVKCVQ